MFEVGNNELSGLLPALTGLGNLNYFEVANNRLSGNLPRSSIAQCPGRL